MATSSILGGSHLPEEISDKDLHALGPSDNSDSGSDAVGAYGADELASDSDAAGTGERAAVGTGGSQHNVDILPHHIEQAPGSPGDGDADDSQGGALDDLDDLGDIEDLLDDSEADGGDEDDDGPGASGNA